MKRKYKRYRPMQKEAVAVLLALLLLTLGFTLYSEQPAEPESRQRVTRTVQPGDTVWDIAAEYNPDGHDIRNYVAIITRVNQLQNRTLQPGETLIIPLLSK